MDINELNNQFLKKKQSNNSQTKHLDSLKDLANKCFQKAKEMPAIPEKKKDSDYMSLYGSSKYFHLPSRFINADIKDFGFKDEKLIKYFSDNIFKKALNAGRGIVLCGSYGKGKTHFAYAFAKEFIKAYSNYEKTESKFPLVLDFQEIQDSLHGEDKKKFVDNCIKAKLLIIDDFMSIDLTTWEMGQLTQIFNKRYNFMNPVVLTTNLNPEELKKKCGLRMWERIEAVNYIKEVIGKSQRYKYDQQILD